MNKIVRALNWIRYGVVAVFILIVLYVFVVPYYKFWLPVVMDADPVKTARDLERVGFGLHSINNHFHPDAR